MSGNMKSPLAESPCGAGMWLCSACLTCSHRLERGCSCAVPVYHAITVWSRGCRYSACLACMKPWVQFPAPYKLAMAMMPVSTPLSRGRQKDHKVKVTFWL